MLNMKINLCLFAGQIENIKSHFESKVPLNKENYREVKRKVELETLYVQLEDGNYNLKMLKRAFDLAHEFKEEDKIIAFREKLQEFKVKGLLETGSRARSEIVDQLSAIIVKDINPYGVRSKYPLNYLAAVKQLDKMMKDNALYRGDLQYEEGLKEAWVIVREEMYQKDELHSKRKHLESYLPKDQKGIAQDGNLALQVSSINKQQPYEEKGHR